MRYVGATIVAAEKQ